MHGMEALERAIRIAGSQAALASICGVVQGAVANWKSRGNVPPEYCPAIERATNGAVTRRDLRPEDWQRIWPELATQEKVA